jgi:hypothetical protein
MPGSVRRLSSVPNPISAAPAWPARSAAIPSLICSDAFRVRGASGLRCWPEAERPHRDPGECGHRPPRGGRGEHGGQARAEGRVADVGCSVVDRRAGPGVVAQMPFDQPGQQWSRGLSGRHGGRGARSGWTKRNPRRSRQGGEACQEGQEAREGLRAARQGLLALSHNQDGPGPYRLGLRQVHRTVTNGVTDARLERILRRALRFAAGRATFLTGGGRLGDDQAEGADRELITRAAAISGMPVRGIQRRWWPRAPALPANDGAGRCRRRSR